MANTPNNDPTDVSSEKTTGDSQIATTQNHGYNVPPKGFEDWDLPLNQNFTAFDVDIEIRDERGNLDGYTPKEGAKFLATDQGGVYLGENGEWRSRFALPRRTGQGTIVSGRSSIDLDVSGATIAGGLNNSASGPFSTVSGGRGHTANGQDSAIAGGKDNEAGGRAASVAGGWSNEAGGDFASVGGGLLNNALGKHATIAGGGPSATPNSDHNNFAVGGWATIGGGGGHVVGKPTEDGEFATVGGGRDNAARGRGSTIAGGMENWAVETGTTVAGGTENVAAGEHATVAGGDGNQAAGDYGAVVGGRENEVSGNYSFAAGRRAKAEHDGSFVWSDSSTADLASTGEDQLLIGASGGTGIGIRKPETRLHVADKQSGPVVIVENRRSQHEQVVLELRTDASGDPPDAFTGPGKTYFFETTEFLEFTGAGGEDTFGHIALTKSGTLKLESLGADYAEHLPQIDPTEGIKPGDIVGVYAGEITKETVDADRAMVVSDEAIVAGNAPLDNDGGDHEPVAFIGQVRTKIRGPVEAGDLIAPSGEGDGTGVGVPADEWDPDEHGPLVGQAWESDADEDVTRVTVAVGLDHTEAIASQLRTARKRTEELEGRVEQQATVIEGLRKETQRLEELEERLEQVEASTGAVADGGEPAPGDEL